MGKRRVKLPPPPEDTEKWMTTFADLVSLMLTFFILLVSMSTLDETGLSDISTFFKRAVHVLESGDGSEIDIRPIKPIQKYVSARELMLAMRQHATKVLKESSVEHHVSTAILNDQLILSLDDAVLFRPGSEELSQAARDSIERLANLFAMTPGLIRVEGHTDNAQLPPTSVFDDPWQLSLARAAEVMNVLKMHGVNPRRLSIAGYGPSKPVSTNRTAFGRERNRRVDIIVYTSNLK
ncbi:MAG: flagellar motor protein MotB [Mariprofundaceae bacterium]